ncbi:carbohydrate ABC transporter permease [Mobilicoccus pelagius]|uniref:Putative sugar ABC transporter permease protein n=1 Tax=Mobilicoccus pelagius NBRC 104925 TaxID=1089455 RepID=H5URA9_9MICO|nr:sugar ABC transporter permease [Mobilicoccus pelagius]GAB48267.1 putative sugar ABC transporter permease protein [Mobilicoccus pelagius NBRC 104925]
MSTVATAPTENPRDAATPRKAGISDRARGERSLGWKLAGPAFLVMVLVTAYPILQAIWNSFFSYRLTDPGARKFVGLGNYATILSDSLFWNAVGNTLFITVVTVVVELVIGFGLAMLMNRVVWPRKALRTIVLIPYSIITVVSAFAWFYGFQASTGFINHWLGVFGWPLDFNWFGHWWSAMFVICASEIWKTTPFMSLLLLSGLAQIDGAMEEAAKVDGATFWQRLFKVILPNMKAAIMVAVLFRTLDAFRIFDNVFIMTQGAQGTTTFSLLAYDQTINRVEIGMGSAISVLLFLSVLLIAAIFVRGFKVDLTGGRG